MAQWVRLQLGNGTYAGKPLISSAAVKEMATPQTVIRLEGQMARLYPEAHFLNYGLGWFLSDYRGRKLVEHGGAIDGMRALVAMIPEEKLGVVILTNLSGTILSVPLSYRIFDAYLGAPARDWSAEMLKTMNALEEQARAAAAKAGIRAGQRHEALTRARASMRAITRATCMATRPSASTTES